MNSTHTEWHILLIDDDHDDYILTYSILSEIESHRIDLEWAPNYQEAMQKLPAKNWDAVLVDYDLGLENGIQLLQQAREIGITAPQIMVTGRDRYEVAREALQAGAYDYLTKDELTASLLERVIRYAKERQRCQQLLEDQAGKRTDTPPSHSQQDTINSYYKNYFEFAPHAYLVTNSSGEILDANQAAVLLFNQRKKDLVRRPLSGFLSWEHRAGFLKKLLRLCKKQEIQEFDLAIFHPSPSATQIHAVASPIKGIDNETFSIHWLMNPITKVTVYSLPAT